MSLAKTLSRLRGFSFVLIAVVVVAVTVLGASSIQRSAEQRAFDRVEHSQQLLAVWLNRTNELRIFLQTGSIPALDDSARLVGSFRAAAQVEEADLRDVSKGRALLGSEMQLAQRWQSLAAVAVAQIRRHGVRPLPLAITKPRSNASAAFQAANERLTTLMETRRKSDIETATEIGDGIVVLASLILAIAGLAFARARQKSERRAMEIRLGEEQARAADERSYVEERRRLSQVMLAAETQEEACQLAKQAIESRVSGSSVAVLRCEPNPDGLTLLTTPPPESSGLAQALTDSTPRSCLAIRLGGTQTNDADAPATVTCELCGQSDYAICEPLVAGGEVTGSMLITHPRPLDGSEQRTIDDTVAFTIPVLANLRNLALAHSRAHTDTLTGLPNRRALDEVLTRMFAQADRSGEPLSLVLVDIDHFKDVNDTLGHECGDELLATVATALAQSVRASDLVARFGGDEFVVALPATDFEGARILAEKMAGAISRARVRRFDWDITASFGIASYPDHGPHVEAVMRCADNALYQAKSDGRDCVRLAPVILPAAAVF